MAVVLTTLTSRRPLIEGHYGEAISVASAMMTMLFTGAFVWLIKFL